MSRAWQSGSTREWRRIRAWVLTRDERRCQLKLEGCTTIATQVHHTVGREVTGDNPDYLVASCLSCNNKVGDPRRHDPAPRPSTRW